MKDVDKIIDELENVLLNNKKSFFTGKIFVEEVKVTELLSHLRAAVPDSFREAKSILTQCDTLIYEAEQRADKIIRSANETREKLINESEVVKAAQAEADRLMNSTKSYCDEILANVYRDLDSELFSTAEHLNSALNYIETVRDELHKRQVGKDGQN